MRQQRGQDDVCLPDADADANAHESERLRSRWVVLELLEQHMQLLAGELS
jgi:hypothetical protein